jgi:hypothetical protein
VRPRFTMGALRGPKEFPSRARFFASLPLQVTREQVELINFLTVGLRLLFRPSLWGCDLASVLEYRPPDFGFATIPYRPASARSRDCDYPFYTAAGNARRKRLRRA